MRFGGRCLRQLVWIFIIVVAPAAYGATEDEAYYDEALEAFRAGDYERAVDGFLRANTAGRSDATLYYNLGSSYYKLERYTEAGIAFQRAAQDPKMAPLATYNLGLVAYQQGNTAIAASHFRRTLAIAENDKLRQLAEAMLARSEPAPSTAARAAPPASPWTSFVEAGYGDDDNVTLISADQALISSYQRDRFLELLAYAGRRLTGDSRKGVRIAGGIYALRYFDLTAFDTTTLHLGIGRNDTWNEWRMATDLDVYRTTLSANPFTRTSTLTVQGRRRIPGFDQLRLRYRLSRIDELATIFDYLDGWRNEFDASLRWRAGTTRLRLDYEYEYNNREDRRTTPFISASPQRNTLRAVARQPFTNEFTGTLDLQYRYSRYRDPNEVAPGVFVQREDIYTRTIGRFEYALSDDKELSLEYRFTDNRSNIPYYTYDRHQITMSFYMDW